MFIYVIRCAGDHIYVGRTNTPTDRIIDHFTENGSAWTIKWRPIELLEMFEADIWDEDKTVIKYMSKYGIEKVRGGTFSQIELTPETKLFLQKMISGAKDKCFKCGGDHFIESCDVCYRCGREGHKKDNCLAATHVRGQSLYGCYRCGREGHWIINCFYETDFRGSPIGKSITKGYAEQVGNCIIN